MFLNGYGLNGQEEYLIEELIKCWHKKGYIANIDRTEITLAEVIRDDVVLQEKRLVERLDEALGRIDEELFGKLNKLDRSISIANIRSFVE